MACVCLGVFGMSFSFWASKTCDYKQNEMKVNFDILILLKNYYVGVVIFNFKEIIFKIEYY